MQNNKKAAGQAALKDINIEDNIIPDPDRKQESETESGADPDTNDNASSEIEIFQSLCQVYRQDGDLLIGQHPKTQKMGDVLFDCNTKQWRCGKEKGSGIDDLRASINRLLSPKGTGASELGIERPLLHYPVLGHDAEYGLAWAATEAIASKGKSEADPVGVLITILSWFGCCCGSKVYVRVGDTQLRPNINALLVGKTSRGRKGTGKDGVKTLTKIASKSYPNINIRISPGPASTGEGIVAEVRDPSTLKNKETGEPLDPGISDKRLQMIVSEFSASLKAANREGNTLSAVIRCLSDDGCVDIITKHQPIKCTDAHVSIAGHITEHDLKTCLREVDIYNGFANRFIFTLVRRQGFVPRPTGIDLKTAEKLAMQFADVVKFAHNLSGEIDLDQEASALWHKKYGALTRDYGGIYGAITSRAEAHVMRLALIFALLDMSRVIKVEHLKAALAVWDYAGQSVRFIFGSATIDKRSERIVELLKAGPKTQTELNDAFSGHLSGDALAQLLQDLEAAERVCHSEKSGSKGRPAVLWQLNPDSEPQGAEYAEIAEETLQPG